MQTAWKHRGAALHGRMIGFTAIPDLFVFGVAISLMAPLIDAFLVVKLTSFFWNLVSGAQGALSGIDRLVLVSYIALPLFDVAVVLCAFRLEPEEDKKLLWALPFQTLLYRQILYISVIRATWRAITGTLAGWSKLERSAAALGSGLLMAEKVAVKLVVKRYTVRSRN